MDDKKKDEESFQTEEIESSEEEVHEEKPEDEPESKSEEQDEVKENMESEVENEQPKRFFHANSSQPEIYAGASKGGSRKKLYLVLIVLALLALGAFFYSVRSGSKDTKLSPTPVPVVQSTPKPTPALEFERSEYTLRVLNGTQTQGLAASVSAKLKELGYQIERVGNATNSAFEKTVVRVKPQSDILLETLLKDLTSDYSGEEGPELKDSEPSDAEIILGEK